MSIRKQLFGTILAFICALLLLMGTLGYLLLYSALTTKITDSQAALINANAELFRQFTASIDQMAYQCTSDEQLGQLLSQPVREDPLQDVNTKGAVVDQFSYYLSSQLNLANGGFTTAFYINPALPISSLFEVLGLPDRAVQSSRVYSAAQVMEEGWFQTALSATQSQYVFLDEAAGLIRFAKKIQNTYYTGAYQKNGEGVLVNSISLARFGHYLSLSQVTPHSTFALVSAEGTVLYQLDDGSFLPESSFDASLAPGSQTLRLGGQAYLCTVKSLSWGMKLIFLTPNQDVSDEVRTLMRPLLWLAGAALVCACLVAAFLARGISNPVVCLTRTISSIEDSRTANLNTFDSFRSSKEMRQLAGSFKELLTHNNRLIQDLQEQSRKQRLSELRALQAQINPHFMLNAMNAVNWMALARGQDDIADTVSSIANMMRYSITEPDRLVSVQEELDNIQEYITIYNLRFRQRVDLHLDCAAPLSTVIIPKFTLQPLIENSIKHGMTRSEAGIAIFIAIRPEVSRTEITVRDTGRGADAEKLNDYLAYRETDLKVTHGFGIRNVNERMRLRYGNGSGLRYTTDADGRLTAHILMLTQEKSTHEQK